MTVDKQTWYNRFMNNTGGTIPDANNQNNGQTEVSSYQTESSGNNPTKPIEENTNKGIWSNPLTFVVISLVISVVLLIFGMPMIPMTKDERLELIHSPAAMKCRSEGYNEGTCFSGSVTYFVEAIGSALLMLALISIAFVFMLKAMAKTKGKQSGGLVSYLIVLDIFLVTAASIPYLLYLAGGLF